MRPILLAIALIAGLFLAPNVQAQSITQFQTLLGSADTGCDTDPTSGTDGCINGLSYQTPNFYYSGYPNQSYCGSSATGACAPGVTVYQPATYAHALRPNWWMCGIDYPCGPALRITGYITNNGTTNTLHVVTNAGRPLAINQLIWGGKLGILPPGYFTCTGSGSTCADTSKCSASACEIADANGDLLTVGSAATPVRLANFLDPATIGSDALANPDGANLTCTYSASQALVPAGGAGVLCTKTGTPTAPVIDGYFWGYSRSNPASGINGVAGTNGCVALIIKPNAWVTTTNPVTLQNNLFINGPNCNAYPMATTAASGTGSVATITVGGTNSAYAAQVPPVGSLITVAGVTPSGYNGTYTVTSNSCTYSTSPSDQFVCTGSNTFSYANATTGAQSVAGNAYVNDPGSVFQVYTSASSSTPYALSFLQNYVAGCGGALATSPHENQDAMEAYFCAINFPSPYYSPPGFAPFSNAPFVDSACGPRIQQYNVWLHTTGRPIQGSCNGNGYSDYNRYFYWEGGGYIHYGQGEHMEFKEYGNTVPGSVAAYFQYGTFLQTKYADAGPGEGGESSIYYGSASGGAGTANITVSGTTATAAITANPGSNAPVAGQPITFLNSSDPNLNGTFTVTSYSAPNVVFTCAGCTSSDAATGVNYSNTYILFSGGSVDHNLIITNINPILTPYWSYFSAAAVYSYNTFGTLANYDNFIDPTGSYSCWDQVSAAVVGSGVTFGSGATANINMLGTLVDPSNLSVNQFNSYYAIAGSYTSANGNVTLYMSSPVPYVSGTVVNVGDMAGTSLVEGTATLTSVTNGGLTITYTSGSGYGALNVYSAQVRSATTNCLGAQ